MGHATQYFFRGKRKPDAYLVRYLTPSGWGGGNMNLEIRKVNIKSPRGDRGRKEKRKGSTLKTNSPSFPHTYTHDVKLSKD